MHVFDLIGLLLISGRSTDFGRSSRQSLTSNSIRRDRERALTSVLVQKQFSSVLLVKSKGVGVLVGLKSIDLFAGLNKAFERVKRKKKHVTETRPVSCICTIHYDDYAGIACVALPVRFFNPSFNAVILTINDVAP